jgi:hypothetical protein
MCSGLSRGKEGVVNAWRPGSAQHPAPRSSYGALVLLTPRGTTRKQEAAEPGRDVADTISFVFFAIQIRIPIFSLRRLRHERYQAPAVRRTKLL